MIVGTGRPKDGYRNKRGQEVVGTTTILSAMESKPQLINWAVGLALKGISHTEARQQAAEEGGASHDAIHALLTGGEYTVPPDMAEVVNLKLDQFNEWHSKHQPELVSAEVPMVSEVHNFGGTYDLVARLGPAGLDTGDRMLTVVDYKTGKSGPYASWLAQLGAYGILYEEETGTKLEQGCILHLSQRRKHHKAVWLNAAQLEYCGNHFLGLLREYRRRKVLESFLRSPKKKEQ